MKFKYQLGERVLFNPTNREALGTITAIIWTQDAVKYRVESNEGPLDCLDSDILGTVTVKRAPTPRVRKKKTKLTEFKTGSGVHMGNGLTDATVIGGA